MNIEISKERMLEMTKKLASMDFCPEQKVFYKNILRMVKADAEGRLLVLPETPEDKGEIDKVDWSAMQKALEEYEERVKWEEENAETNNESKDI